MLKWILVQSIFDGKVLDSFQKRRRRRRVVHKSREAACTLRKRLQSWLDAKRHYKYAVIFDDECIDVGT